MANIRERIGRTGRRTFEVQVRMVGYPSRTATFPTRRLAERWAKTVEAEMIEGRHFRGTEARRRTLADAIDRYVREVAPKKRDCATRVGRLNWWKEKIGHLRLADVTSAVIVEYRGKLEHETFTAIRRGEARGEPSTKTRKGSTINRYLAYLSHLFTIARKEWHWVSINPFDGVGRLKEGNGRVRFLTEDERTRLLAETAKDPQLHTLVVLALATAARAGELLNLTWADLELDEGRATLRGKADAAGERRTKNDSARAVWLHVEALKLLKDQQARAPHAVRVFVAAKGGDGIYDYREPFAEACKRAKVTDFPFHCLRHSSATYLARLGATEQQLKAIGGWKSNVVSRYVHLAAEDAREIQQRMNNKILGSIKE